MGRLGNWRATYTPGRWVVLAGPSALVIMPPAPASASTLLNDLWDDLLAAASMPDLVERLASFRIDQLPSFAAFFWHDDQVRSLMRGAVHAIDVTTGARVAEGADVVTWVEAGLADVKQVRIDLEPVDQDQVLQLPLVTGVVTASALVLDATAAPSSVQLTGAALTAGITDESDETDEPQPVDEAHRTDEIHGAHETFGADETHAADEAPDIDEPVDSADIAVPVVADEPVDPATSAVSDEVAEPAPLAEEPDAAEPETPAEEPTAAPASGLGLISGDVDPAAGMWGAPDVPDWARETEEQPEPAESTAEDAATEQFPAVPAAAMEAVPTAPSPSSDEFPADDTQLMPSVDRPGAPAAAPTPWGAPAPGAQPGLPPMPGPVAPGGPSGFPAAPPYGQQPGPTTPPQQPNPFGAPPPPDQFGQPHPGQPGQPQPGQPAQQAPSPHQPPPFGQPHPGQPHPAQAHPQPGQPQPGQPNPFAQPPPPDAFTPQQQPYQQGWGQPPAQQGPPDQPNAPYARPPEPVAPGPGPSAGGGLISAMPDFSGASAASATPAPGAGDEVDHDGATIFQTGLARALKSAPTGGGRDDSFVLASVCVQQHPNPPGATQCRLCSSPVPQQNPRLVARPVLATLRPSSGSAVEVDRNVLIGRAPSASRVARDQLPHLMTVPSPSHDISRTHVQVHPDEWSIVVTDLHSTNGTTLVHPGGDERERLIPGEPVSIQIGSVLDLGDGVTVVVDAP